MMFYRELGEGDPVVLLHAFPLNGKMFEPQMEAFSRDRRVIAPDYPGFSRRGYPVSSSPTPAPSRTRKRRRRTAGRWLAALPRKGSGF